MLLFWFWDWDLSCRKVLSWIQQTSSGFSPPAANCSTLPSPGARKCFHVRSCISQNITCICAYSLWVFTRECVSIENKFFLRAKLLYVHICFAVYLTGSGRGGQIITSFTVQLSSFNLLFLFLCAELLVNANITSVSLPFHPKCKSTCHNLLLSRNYKASEDNLLLVLIASVYSNAPAN